MSDKDIRHLTMNEFWELVDNYWSTI